MIHCSSGMHLGWAVLGVLVLHQSVSPKVCNEKGDGSRKNSNAYQLNVTKTKSVN